MNQCSIFSQTISHNIYQKKTHNSSWYVHLTPNDRSNEIIKLNGRTGNSRKLTKTFVKTLLRIVSDSEMKIKDRICSRKNSSTVIRPWIEQSTDLTWTPPAPSPPPPRDHPSTGQLFLGSERHLGNTGSLMRGGGACVTFLRVHTGFWR